GVGQTQGGTLGRRLGRLAARGCYHGGAGGRSNHAQGAREAGRHFPSTRPNFRSTPTVRAMLGHLTATNGDKRGVGRSAKRPVYRERKTRRGLFVVKRRARGGGALSRGGGCCRVRPCEPAEGVRAPRSSAPCSAPACM